MAETNHRVPTRARCDSRIGVSGLLLVLFNIWDISNWSNVAIGFCDTSGGIVRRLSHVHDLDFDDSDTHKATGNDDLDILRITSCLTRCC